jgi:hypothetical protein
MLHTTGWRVLFRSEILKEVVDFSMKIKSIALLRKNPMLENIYQAGFHHNNASLCVKRL